MKATLSPKMSISTGESYSEGGRKVLNNPQAEQDDYITRIFDIARKEAFHINNSYKVIVLSTLNNDYITS